MVESPAPQEEAGLSVLFHPETRGRRGAAQVGVSWCLSSNGVAPHQGGCAKSAMCPSLCSRFNSELRISRKRRKPEKSGKLRSDPDRGEQRQSVSRHRAPVKGLDDARATAATWAQVGRLVEYLPPSRNILQLQESRRSGRVFLGLKERMQGSRLVKALLPHQTHSRRELWCLSCADG
jgi:hypothetical protein